MVPEVSDIRKDELVSKVEGLKKSNYRLVQIDCTELEQFEINYTFDKDYILRNLRLRLDKTGEEIPSISGVYWNAFIYENEIHDLFGIGVKGMAVDFGGNLYRTKVRWPFRGSGGADG